MILYLLTGKEQIKVTTSSEAEGRAGLFYY